MNLHCNMIELWQTPTYITYMCMTFDDGEPKTRVNGNQAKEALQRYIHWIKRPLGGAWNVREVRSHNDAVRFHLEEIQKVGTENSYKLAVYIM